eukprot:TRINITY_DN489_c1_g1_i1.p1 TRINITY_DN489_c1_g1~~TRINITY_DN489_c1_g1_i1.p1  ORF type:complete len:552 (-),score=109.03 TRINITY_DN489_c1_g1_i1:1711-3366(-)
MALDSLVEPRVLALLQAAKRRYGNVIIERVPTPQEVSNFLKQLQSHCHPWRVSERLHFSDRDGTVAFSRVVEQPPPAFRAEFPQRELMVRLHTVTQDYTNRSNAAWSPTSGWAQALCHDVLQPQHVPFVNQLLADDAAHNFLLTYENRPCYLHVVRRDMHTERKRNFVLYTVEVARRLKAEGDANMPSLSSIVNSWPSQHDFTRRRANPDEVTLWAVLNIVPSQQRHDHARLQIIRDAINAVAPFCKPPPAALTSAPRTLHAGNTYQLLRVRHSGYQDGRARYAVVRSVLKSEALAPHATSPSPMSTPSTNQAANRMPASPVLQTTRDNRTKLVFIALASLLTGALGLIYLIRLRYVDDDGVDDVVGVAIGIVFGIMLPSAAVWSWICYGGRSRPDANEPKVAIEAVQLVNQTKNASVEERLQAATCAASRAHYNDNWLTFTALQYTGSEEYPERFCISELMEAGYKTTFALDGREVLVTPERKWVRLLALDDDGDAVFDNLGTATILSVEDERVEGEVFGHRVVPDTTGEWTADLRIGSKALLRVGVNNV